MRRRLEFIFPDIKTAQRAWKELLLACVNNDCIHFIAKPDIELGKMLKRANVFESTDMIHQGMKGVFLGGDLPPTTLPIISEQSPVKNHLASLSCCA